MSNQNLSPSDKLEAARLIDAAMAEYHTTGRVVTLCPTCSVPIAVERINEETFQLSCICGRFNGTIRGL